MIFCWYLIKIRPVIKKIFDQKPAEEKRGGNILC